MTTQRDEAGRLLNAGIERLQARALDDALELFEQAAVADPSYYAPHFQIGLVHKLEKRWPQAAHAFVKASSLVPQTLSADRHAAVLWNVGIAASKIADWTNAHAAWRGLGNEVGTRDDGSPSVPMGYAFVRRGDKEPALGERVDPARVLLKDANASKHGLTAGEIVVHDGARIATIAHDGVDLPVFPVL